MKIITNKFQRRTGRSITLAALLAALWGFTQSASAQTIYIDFGNSTTQMSSPNAGTYWNNITNLNGSSGGGASTGVPIALVTDDNSSSGISLTMTTLFANENHTGTASPTTSVSEFNYSDLGIDSLYISGTNTAEFTLSGLDSSKEYVFTMFASRAAGGIRTADYTFTGINTDTVTLDAANNTSSLVTTTSISPDGSDEITFSMALSSDNNQGYAYLGGMQITVVPEPASAAIAFGALTLLFTVVRRRYNAHS
ncbi:MAG: hypothetical protein ACQKBT_00560 [Puniceicoccales bacterium]